MKRHMIEGGMARQGASGNVKLQVHIRNQMLRGEKKRWVSKLKAFGISKSIPEASMPE